VRVLPVVVERDESDGFGLELRGERAVRGLRIRAHSAPDAAQDPSAHEA
jgi:hypothetical protein